jgi:hypothetical protein
MDFVSAHRTAFNHRTFAQSHQRPATNTGGFPRDGGYHALAPGEQSLPKAGVNSQTARSLSLLVVLVQRE